MGHLVNVHLAQRISHLQIRDYWGIEESNSEIVLVNREVYETPKLTFRCKHQIELVQMNRKGI
jgi:hypothetical protein